MHFLISLGQIATHMAAFLLFFWVMKKFAWPAVIGSIDERQRKIESGFEEIRRRQSDAEASHKQYEEKLKGIEAEARERIQAAVAEGQRVAAEIAEKARVEAGEQAAASRRKIELEMATARKQLRDDVIRLTMAATERLIQERMNESRDRDLVGSFITELETKTL